eukprot:jgi/Chlat1/8214/Chrsp76S07646
MSLLAGEVLRPAPNVVVYTFGRCWRSTGLDIRLPHLMDYAAGVLVLVSLLLLTCVDAHSHSCIHDRIVQTRRERGLPLYSVAHQQYSDSWSSNTSVLSTGRRLQQGSDPNTWAQLRIVINYDQLGTLAGRDCLNAGDVVAVDNPSSPSAVCSDSQQVYQDCYYTCLAADVMNSAKRTALQQAMSTVVTWWERTLLVNPITGNLKLSSNSACGLDGGVNVPSSFSSTGVANADLVLFVTARPTTGSTLAWAVGCERDQWGRAVAGQVNVGPQYVGDSSANNLLLKTLRHEITHVLGFDPSAFDSYRVGSTKQLQPQVTVSIYDSNLGKQVTRVVTPNVMARGAQHFAMDTASFPGIELEDGGGSGTAGSHWEKRLLHNELMTGTISDDSVTSVLTLALLQDSGWYTANFSQADYLLWGAGQGATFVTQRCNKWGAAYFCTSNNSPQCTADRSGLGYCDIVTYNGDLPRNSQYFSQPDVGGRDPYADYCPYVESGNGDTCLSGGSGGDPNLGELTCPNCRCFGSTLAKSGVSRGSGTPSLGCYQTRCLDNSTLQVSAGGNWAQCPTEGGTVTFTGFSGSVTCPPAVSICTVYDALGGCPNSCSQQGNCVNNTCICYDGFQGADCSYGNCPNGCSGNGDCSSSGSCVCRSGYTGIDCSTKVCDSNCAINGGTCVDGVCKFRCSSYQGYTCTNATSLESSLSFCADTIALNNSATYCAPSDPSVLEQLETTTIQTNYDTLLPTGISFINGGDCKKAAKNLACWLSLQRCDSDGVSRLRTCKSACDSYNKACGGRLDCSSSNLQFSSQSESDSRQCTGQPTKQQWWRLGLNPIVFFVLIGVGVSLLICITLAFLRWCCRRRNKARTGRWQADMIPTVHPSLQSETMVRLQTEGQRSSYASPYPPGYAQYPAVYPPQPATAYPLASPQQVYPAQPTYAAPPPPRTPATPALPPYTAPALSVPPPSSSNGPVPLYPSVPAK